MKSVVAIFFNKQSKTLVLLSVGAIGLKPSHISLFHKIPLGLSLSGYAHGAKIFFGIAAAVQLKFGEKEIQCFGFHATYDRGGANIAFS